MSEHSLPSDATGPFVLSGYSGYKQVQVPRGRLFAFDSEGNYMLTCSATGGVIYKVPVCGVGLGSPPLQGSSAGDRQWPGLLVQAAYHILLGEQGGEGHQVPSFCCLFAILAEVLSYPCSWEQFPFQKP